MGALPEDLELRRLLEIGPGRERGLDRGVLRQAEGRDIGPEVGDLGLVAAHRIAHQVQLLKAVHQLPAVAGASRSADLQGAAERVRRARPLVALVGAVDGGVAVAEVDLVLHARGASLAVCAIPRRQSLLIDGGLDPAHRPLEGGESLPRRRRGDVLGDELHHRPLVPLTLGSLEPCSPGPRPRPGSS